MAKILVVDDRPLNRNFLVTLLGYYGHTLSEAADGLEALAAMATHKPELVISDILMPNMDGEEFVRRLRADPATKNMPVIFYTATYRAREARTVAGRVGVRWVLAKPSEPKTIMDTVAEALGVATVEPAAQQAAPPASAPVTGPGAPGKGVGEQLATIESLTLRLGKLLEGALEITNEQAASLAGARALEAALHDVQSLGLRLTGLIELGQTLASVRDPAMLIAMFCRALQDVLSARYAGVVVLDAHDRTLEQFSALGLGDAARAQVALQIAQCPAQERVLVAGRPLRHSGEGGTFAAGLPQSHPPVHSFLACPVVALGRTAGWMYVADRLGLDDFTADDERIALTLASQLALAWENINFHEDLEEQVAQRTRELEAANRELESFSYSVSHDLRGPLRAIDGFSAIVLRDHAAALPAEGQRYLGLVREGAQQMAQLIDDLLSFARTTRQPIEKRTVAVKELVNECLKDYRAEIAERKAEVEVRDLPDCRADPALLKQVLVNLLGNAVKYTRKQPRAKIEVGCRPDNGEEAIYVKDNGVGFDMKHADKLFGVFQRLHHKEEFEGTGVGLAIVQRVVHRHGGRVWAEAEPGKGATFYFTLGKEHETKNPAGR
jgi:signal transduction histidine kinase/ActR/RegA family two-component response regulator